MLNAIDLAKNFFQDVLDAEFEYEQASGKKYLVVTRGTKVRVELDKNNNPKFTRRNTK